MLKCPKVIESQIYIPRCALVVAYLFHALEIQMTHCNGQPKVEGTIAEITNTRYKLLSTRELCAMVVLDRYYNSTVHNGSSCSRVLCSQ